MADGLSRHLSGDVITPCPPPLPPPRRGGVTHRSNFSPYEGAATTVEDGRGCARGGAHRRTAGNKEFAMQDICEKVCTCA